MTLTTIVREEEKLFKDKFPRLSCLPPEYQELGFGWTRDVSADVKSHLHSSILRVLEGVRKKVEEMPVYLVGSHPLHPLKNIDHAINLSDLRDWLSVERESIKKLTE